MQQKKLDAKICINFSNEKTSHTGYIDANDILELAKTIMFCNEIKQAYADSWRKQILLELLKEK